jgi:transposase-like protein
MSPVLLRVAGLNAFDLSLVKRGLRGVRLVTSDAHEGLKQAIATVLSGATWQQCRPRAVHAPRG